MWFVDKFMTREEAMGDGAATAKKMILLTAVCLSGTPL
jgi:hypothetical protein